MMSLLPKTKIERLLLSYIAGLGCGAVLFLLLGLDILQDQKPDGALVALSWGLFITFSMLFIRSLKIFFDLRAGIAAEIVEDKGED